MAQISKIERILNLFAFLLKERKPVPWRAIAGKVIGYDDDSDPKSLERRFERDKAALKELGIPIRFFPPGTHESEGYIVAREHCFLDPLHLSPQEVALLNLVSELGMRRGEKSAELLTALQKLRFDDQELVEGRGAPGESGDDLPPGESAWERSLLALDKVASLRSNPNLERLTEAILQNRAVRFTYSALSSGETRERRVDPYGLGFAHGAWYLVGRDHLRDAVRQFKLDRIRDRVEPEGEPGAFAVPAGFSVTPHVAKAPWAQGGDEEPAVLVRVLVGQDIAWFSEGPLESKAALERDDGSVELSFDVRDETAFLRWLLRHARHVRVLEPAGLRARFIAALEGIAARHQAPAGGVEDDARARP